MDRQKLTLNELADVIAAQAKKGDELRLATAMLVRELKLRIEAGEAGEGVKWTEWGNQRFGRSSTWLYDLNAIASAGDPKAALREYHRKNCERQKHRNDRLVERDPDRCEVIKLIRAMEIADVHKVRRFIRDLTGE